MTELLRIGNTRHLKRDGPPPPIDSYYTLFQGFVTDVWIPIDRPIGARVDTFNFLYSLLGQIYHFSSQKDVLVDVGESLILVAEIRGDRCTVRVQYPGDIVTEEMSRSSCLWLLCSLVSELRRSMLNAGIEIERYVREFPPHLTGSGALSTSSSSIPFGGTIYTDIDSEKNPSK